MRLHKTARFNLLTLALHCSAFTLLLCMYTNVHTCTHAVAVEEENELESSQSKTLPVCNNFDKLTELEAHLVRHRELFLSRQIETYKIDMVR